MKVRRKAFEILVKAERGEFARDLLEGEDRITGKDRGLLTQIVYGTIRYQGALDRIIQPHIPIENRIILRIAAYQLIYLSRIPRYAIVNESVDMAKIYSTIRSSRFINAVLRKWCREVPQVDEKYTHPEWLRKRWIRQLGHRQAEKLCSFNNQIPPLMVRINTLKVAPLSVKKQFKKIGHPLGYATEIDGPVSKLRGFKEGYFQVQDISGMYVGDMVDVRPGMRVLDLCAAPGGKTCHIGQKMRNRGEIVAVDVSANKIDKIKENCRRLGIKNIKTVVGDGRKINLGRFDWILVDAPCSNTGVLRRRIEARWRLRQDDFKRLAKLQLELLDNAARQVKRKGKIVYSTCSIDKEENRDVVEKFMKNHHGFRLQKVLIRTPYKDDMDGVYAALLAGK